MVYIHIIYKDDSFNSSYSFFYYSHLLYLILFGTGDSGHLCVPAPSEDAFHVSLLCLVLSLGCDVVYLVKEASIYLYFVELLKIKMFVEFFKSYVIFLCIRDCNELY